MIVTHTSPDLDAIGAVWLLQRYGGMDGAMVVFVNTGNPDATALAEADAVVDTGREYAPGRRRFDHHQLPGATANDTCAALQVFEWLLSESKPIEHLRPLVTLIFEGDTGKPGANLSRAVGIHALISVRKAARMADAQLLNYGCALLDDLATHLEMRKTARESLEAFTVYLSADNLVRALDGAPQGATFAAFEEGARLVVFASESPDTVACGVMRGGEGNEPHCGGLVYGLLDDFDCGLDDITPAVFDELARWFRHPAGFFAGRGTAKAPDPRPLTASVVEIARALDRAWKR